MLPPFGFSVGDFIAAANLIKDISRALKDVGGASSQYQHAVIELESLERALSRVSALEPSASNIHHVNAIRGMALACRLPLQDFLAKIQKYEASMGASSPRRSLKGMAHKAKWGVCVSEEVKNLRALIVGKVVSINMLLATHTSETVSDLESSNREERSNLLSEIIRIRSTLAQLHQDVQEERQAAAERSTGNSESLRTMHCKMDAFTERTDSKLDSISSSAQSMQESVISLRDICQQIIYFLGTFPNEIRDLLRRILQTNFQIYNLLLQSQHNVGVSPTLLLESNIRFEDALGRSRELPYQWFRHWEVFEGMLHAEFKGIPGESKVVGRDYSIHDAKIPGIRITRDNWQQSVFPGSTISMAMRIYYLEWELGKCPRARCKSGSIRIGKGRTITCSECGLKAYTDPEIMTLLGRVGFVIHDNREDLLGQSGVKSPPDWPMPIDPEVGELNAHIPGSEVVSPSNLCVFPTPTLKYRHGVRRGKSNAASLTLEIWEPRTLIESGLSYLQERTLSYTPRPPLVFKSVLKREIGIEPRWFYSPEGKYTHTLRAVSKTVLKRKIEIIAPWFDPKMRRVRHRLPTGLKSLEAEEAEGMNHFRSITC